MVAGVGVGGAPNESLADDSFAGLLWLDGHQVRLRLTALASRTLAACCIPTTKRAATPGEPAHHGLSFCGVFGLSTSVDPSGWAG